ncbi:MAG: efflux RND transporter periplasmic adaptor subunit [Sulfurovum sp.]|nr:efflux RND transporter periplasmic adaptor subunit [Sulfurovum sp.]MCB4745814.1 efflux RND transporter periplasmic adaptor subunit [Sulfurovum sp.]MCB4749112.1 efflux RND transporter periplasmic adaptor subunit [Sulfurovum sp.]MCB4751839.1 efflux RND transporter periplasmic adaptor subunit [Sulfurovum sp.]MCB4753915.1 efflux RND transporter periplasmic adaptor subunit [Sulfurovum sp.]
MNKILFIITLLTLCAYANTLTVTGTIVSDNKKYIGARYMGYVKEVYREVGDSVKREDTLFKMDSAEFDILKEQVNLGLEQAEILTDVYRSKLDEIRREKMLLRERKISGANFNFDDMNDNLSITAEHTQSMLKAMQAIVKNAAQKVKEVSVISQYLEVKAPSDGIIVQKNLHVGDMVMPGFPVMVLVDLNHLEIEAQVAETDLLKINKGDFIKFEIPSIHYKGHGRIKSIVPSANPMTHTFLVRISFHKDHKKIYPGMYAKLYIDYTPSKNR